MEFPERTRFIGDEDDLQIWWERSGSLINFASGYTFSMKVAAYRTPETAIFTKSTGFAGAAGSGVEGDGVPNLVVSFATTGELNSITTPGKYFAEIVATAGSGAETTLRMTLNMLLRIG